MFDHSFKKKTPNLKKEHKTMYWRLYNEEEDGITNFMFIWMTEENIKVRNSNSVVGLIFCQ